MCACGSLGTFLWPLAFVAASSPSFVHRPDLNLKKTKQCCAMFHFFPNVKFAFPFLFFFFFSLWSPIFYAPFVILPSFQHMQCCWWSSNACNFCATAATLSLQFSFHGSPALFPSEQSKYKTMQKKCMLGDFGIQSIVL